jgi:ABC-type lipoprotein export system ATPase subunit
MTAVVNAKDLFLLYRAPQGDVAALRGLTLDVRAGELVAVLGPSGAGKSSLLSLCAGFRRPSSGDLSVLGNPIGFAPARDVAALRRRSIGIVRQHYHRSLPAELTVEEIVSLPNRLLGRPPRRAERDARELLGAAGLGRRAEARPNELSGGEQQRVAVCAAMAKRPALILADEPTGELDPRTSELVIDLLLELGRNAGSAALIVTHDPQVALRADRTIHVRDGRLSAEGATTPVLLVDEQGWLRLPRRLRETAGVRERVSATAAPGRIELVVADSERQAPALEGTSEARPAPVEKRARTEVALDRASKSYGGEVVFDRLSWTFDPEELHVLAGPSGSGKTTILNLISGLERPDEGAIWVGGERIDGLGRNRAALWRQKVVGYVSQHSTLVDFLTARENVEIGLALRDFAPDEAAELAERWLGWVGLAKLVDRPAGKLSGGEQRRVALARALAPGPRLLVADEPTAHLDRVSGRVVIRLLRDAAHVTGTTVIAASHDPDLVGAADRRLDMAAARAASIA